MGYNYDNTISLTDAMRMLATNLPNLKRRSAKGCFDLVDVGAKFRRIPMDQFTEYVQSLLDKNEQEVARLKDVLTNLTIKKMTNLSNNFEIDEELKKEFQEQLQFLGYEVEGV